MKRHINGYDVMKTNNTTYTIIKVTRSTEPKHEYDFILADDKQPLKLYSTSPGDVATGDPLVDAGQFEDEAGKAAKEYLRLENETDPPNSAD